MLVQRIGLHWGNLPPHIFLEPWLWGPYGGVSVPWYSSSFFQIREWCVHCYVVVYLDRSLHLTFSVPVLWMFSPSSKTGSISRKVKAEVQPALSVSMDWKDWSLSCFQPTFVLSSQRQEQEEEHFHLEDIRAVSPKAFCCQTAGGGGGVTPWDDIAPKALSVKAPSVSHTGDLDYCCISLKTHSAIQVQSAERVIYLVIFQVDSWQFCSMHCVP